LGSDLADTCKPGNGKQKDKYLEEHNIETFFLAPPKTSHFGMSSPIHTNFPYDIVSIIIGKNSD